MIDTHSHIYLSDFDDDREEVVERARAAGVEKILLPNVDIETIEAMHQLEARSEGYCLAMMGIHPTSIGADYKQLLKQARSFIDTRDYVAIGEIGIDLYWDKTYKVEQMDAFEQQIIWAKEKGLPIVIHCRDAFSEVFEVVEKQLDESLFGVFHSFSGYEVEAARILEYKNFMLGINGVVTFKNTKLREVLKGVPLSKVVLETDAPYLAPVPKRGKRNEPAYLERIVETIAGVYNVNVDEVKQQTTSNAKKLFAL
ncbi:TatD family hydrolase [Carboxylicivirga sediminis]|uniref:TatD family hydrolase n=1 Tax=Carboxylicivirga sediminis TaxID=2006564 RepID=A0A941EZ71_9BACT|nr:TatD family hydrolase [Carboxylicivirga sediminis]MBR8534288.1 TatD family hydrolase [Carboxylicivirga sediminis]